jgi:hypothetical protein
VANMRPQSLFFSTLLSVCHKFEYLELKLWIRWNRGTLSPCKWPTWLRWSTIAMVEIQVWLFPRNK